jgi:nitrogenase iron protein
MYIKIAVYGKGGIGKSTICANLSAAFAAEGKRVLQIGCDPKRDSTRLLSGGKGITTVLDYIKTVPPPKQRLDDIIQTGDFGVSYVEAGGPEPGVGCAGRGILSAFALLDRLGCPWEAYDIIIYDVLGDVVCGGFAVPLRKGFAETVFVVTSEEYMSLYAANNILRGIRNLEQREERRIRLVINRREREGDISHIHRFGQAVKLPIAAEIPRSILFSQAEQAGKTVVELFPESEEGKKIRKIAEAAFSGTTATAFPLSDAELELLVFGPPGCDKGPAKTEERQRKSGGPQQPGIDDPAEAENGEAGRTDVARSYLSKSLLSREPLHGCAFTGAVNTLTQISGAATVAHGPRSCAHLGTSTTVSSGLAAYRRHGIFIPQQLSPRLFSSEMSEEDIIYGSLDTFRRTLNEALQAKPEAVFAVTTCPAGVIGEDVDKEIGTIGEGPPPVIRVTTDGNLEGDYLQGVINGCIEGAAALIDPKGTSSGKTVNIVAEKNIALNADVNFRRMKALLRQLGVGVNCRFVRRTSVDELRGFLQAPLNLLAYSDHLGRVLKGFLTDRFGCSFAGRPTGASSPSQSRTTPTSPKGTPLCAIPKGPGFIPMKTMLFRLPP